MRISRPCYDKRHRCPGWAGGGWKYDKVNRCPEIGYIDWTDAGWFTMRRCPKCGVWVLPEAFVQFAPSYRWYFIRTFIRDIPWHIKVIRQDGWHSWLVWEAPFPYCIRRRYIRRWNREARAMREAREADADQS